MRADQLPLLFTVGQPTVAPDGSFAVVSATRPSFEADAYTGQLWRIPLHGGAPTRITPRLPGHGPRTQPRWPPPRVRALRPRPARPDLGGPGHRR
ncbi:hypothetical protein [Propioniciclava flava]